MVTTISLGIKTGFPSWLTMRTKIVRKAPGHSPCGEEKTSRFSLCTTPPESPSSSQEPPQPPLPPPPPPQERQTNANNVNTEKQNFLNITNLLQLNPNDCQRAQTKLFQ